MARGINRVILIGRLGKDPEVRHFPSGDAIANATIATTESWKDRQTGETKEATEWHNVVFPGKLGEIAGKYLRKGSKVYVEGSLRTRKWQDNSGQDRYTTEIRVRDMQMLDGAPQDQGQREPPQRDHAPSSHEPLHARQPAQQARPAPPMPAYDDMSDDIPF